MTVAGDHLEEMDQLVAKGKEFGKAKCALPAKEARSALVKKVPCTLHCDASFTILS